MLVGARDHQHVVAGHPHVPAEDVGGHAETGHVADVARAVGVRPGDGGQDMGHGVSLLRSVGRGRLRPRTSTTGGSVVEVRCAPVTSLETSESAEVELAVAGALDLEEVRGTREVTPASQMRPASSPRGILVSTGPKNAEPLKAMVGVRPRRRPGPCPRGATPERLVVRRVVHRVDQLGCSPASRRAASTISRSRPTPCLWIRSPNAV